MNPFGEGSREGSNSSSGQSSQTVLLLEQVEQLRREVELLRATITHVAPHAHPSTQAPAIQNQMEHLRLQNERSLAPQNMGAPPLDLHRNDPYQAPDTGASKYVIEAPFAIKPTSKTLRSQSLPKPSAPPGASIQRLSHVGSFQVDRDERKSPPSSGIGRDFGAVLNVPPSSSGIGRASGAMWDVQPSTSGSGAMWNVPPSSAAKSPQTLQALGSLHMLRQEKANLEAEMLQMRNNMSLRSLRALDEVTKVQQEINVLRSSNSVDMSQRTRQVMDQLEQVRREREMLKAKEVDSSARLRLAYFEQNHAAASRARLLEIRKIIISSQELDLAFLVDATGSMQSSIDMIKTTVTTMASGITSAYPECKLRVAFVPYRDYIDAEQDDSELCDFTTSFSGADSTFSRALSRVHAAGGGDDAEDVFSGIARVAQLTWNATNRLLFHIADAPCHGLKFHEVGVGDFYPNGDIYDRIVEDQLRILYEICHVSTYFFCHLNTTTRKMVRVFREAAVGTPLTVLEEQFENISSIPHKVITLCRGTIQKTLGAVNGKVPLDDVRFVTEFVVKEVPVWAQVPVQYGLHFRCKWYPALDDMLSRISHKMALGEEAMAYIQVQIAKHPFSDEGAVRWPYHASLTYKDERPRAMVVKRFKTPLGKDIREIHSRERYWAQMEVQAVSAQMANEFNNMTLKMKNVKKVEFTQVTTIEVNTKYYNMECLLEGEWIRYSNNGGYVNTLDYAAVLQAFTHWTHERSRGLLMVTDLQGVRMTNAFGQNVFCLCDPAVHCTDVMRFTRTNLGEEGFKLFFDTHKCNDVCAKLGLAVGRAGRTLAGTQPPPQWARFNIDPVTNTDAVTIMKWVQKKEYGNCLRERKTRV